jgi:FAD/FMN-containing dehydrogenase
MGSNDVASADRDLEALRAALAGQAFVRDQAGYDRARQAWNLAWDGRPSVVVVAESTSDVVEAVRYARSHGMRIAPLGTGHGADPLEPLESAMLLRTSGMRQVDIEPTSRIARVEAGAVWQDVITPAAQHGLAALSGTSPNVGVTGYTLGGGIGFLARRYGLAANSVTAAEIVTPNGDLIRVDTDHEPGLFWAIRGGGGVGVVTALEMQLYPVKELYAGDLFFPIERTDEVLRAWRIWTDTVPDDVTSIVHILRVPQIPEVPEEMRGQAYVIVEAAYLGDARTGDELIGPLRKLGPGLDTFAMIPASELGQLNMDPPQPSAGEGDGALLADLPVAAIDALVAAVGPDAETPPDSVEVRHLGGALARPVEGGGAQPSIDASYLLYAVGATPTHDLVGQVHAHVQAVKDALAPWHASYDYYNLAETPASAAAVLPPASYRRLQEIKTANDPDQVIISAHPVWPARNSADAFPLSSASPRSPS